MPLPVQVVVELELTVTVFVDDETLTTETTEVAFEAAEPA